MLGVLMRASPRARFPHVCGAANATVSQLYDQGQQIDRADDLAKGMISDAKIGKKLLEELKWRIFRERLCMYALILVRTRGGTGRARAEGVVFPLS